MKEKRAKGENHERPRLEENAISRRRALRFAIGGQVSRPVMIDRFRWNGEHGGASQNGEHRNHEKDRTLRERIPNCAGQKRNRDVAAVIESGIAAEATRELVSCDEAKRERRDCRSKHIPGDREHAQGDRHRPEGWSDKDNGRGCYHRRHGQNDHAALGAGHVDRRADRGLERNPEQSAARRHQPDIGLAPMLVRDQENIDERSEEVADVGGEKIERVERVRDRDHRHRPESDSAQSRVTKRNHPHFVPPRPTSEPGRIWIFIDNALRAAR